ncbi:hypothetical protein [Nostoc sp. 'Peltigera membranacea cyanobiont' 213]|uniref:hypothetical protein n=1 Tax=Nostoc sp. 'Peltigera membranacea cyanobiont' 213 TaxID=2014530 RepID=UPI00117E5405|nr:hypothetical protein [Nostoc sp. 'Peltigera membranacea cyanobiont' 213]
MLLCIPTQISIQSVAAKCYLQRIGQLDNDSGFRRVQEVQLTHSFSAELGHASSQTMYCCLSIIVRSLVNILRDDEY